MPGCRGGDDAGGAGVRWLWLLLCVMGPEAEAGLAAEPVVLRTRILLCVDVGTLRLLGQARCVAMHA